MALDVAHPKTLARLASATAYRFSILRINCSVLDAGHNDDYPAFAIMRVPREQKGGGGSSTYSIL